MLMKIGELAKATSTQAETIRFYEREGLIPPTNRSSGNYRMYEDVHAERLLFIRHCRSLDMSLDEIRILLRFKDLPNQNCDEVNNLLDEHIAHVGHRIKELKILEKTLKALSTTCKESQLASKCGILAKLSSTSKQSVSIKKDAMPMHVNRTHRMKIKPKKLASVV